MKLEIENAVFEYLKKTLNRDMSAMLVRGHSTSVRPVPYIVVDCSEPKPFGTLSAADGLFELVLEIRIADSAHDIGYRIQQKRVNAVFGALENFECSADGISVVSFEFELDSDARDDDNIGNVLKYSVIAQI